MKIKEGTLSRFPSFKIVLLYVVVSAIYIYSSDYFLKICVPDIELLTKIQNYKGLGFILVTATLLFFLVKRNLEKSTAHYREVISMMRASDEQLRKSQDEYMSLFNHSPLPMWIFDNDTLRFLLVNEAALEVYGYSTADYQSMTIRDIRPPEDVATMEYYVTNPLRAEHHAFSDFVRHKKKNGEIILVLIKYSRLTFQGRKARLVSITDVTNEIGIQNKLVDSNSKLQHASEIASLGYWTNDLVNGTIQWSEELYKIFEIDAQNFELTLGNIAKYYHPDDWEEFSKDFFTKFENNKIRESEQRIITGTGKIKWILERQYMTVNKSGIPVKLEGIALEITKRKQFEHEIVESNERFKLLTKATVEALIDWDILNDKVIWGDAFQTLLGYDLSVYDNYLWSKNIHPDDRDRVLNDLAKTLEDPTQEYFYAEFRFLKANGDITYMQHRGLFIRDTNGIATRALGAMIDLTETMERMRQIQSQNKALMEIAWAQSHLVRAPLANLMGLTNILKSNMKAGMSHEELADHITFSAEQLDAVIREIVKKTKGVDGM